MNARCGTLALALAACNCAAEQPPAGGQAFAPVLWDLDGNANAVFAVPEAVYVAGGRDGRGMILRYDGVEWARMDGAGERELRWMSGRSSDDLWAVGDDGAILHFDGAIWAPAFSGTDAALRGVWGAPQAAEAWAVGGAAGGTQGVILRWDGEAWVPDEASGAYDATLERVWGEGGAAWIVGRAVGGDGLILERTGGSWDRVAAAAEADLLAIDGRAGSVFSAGAWVGADAAGAGAVVARADAEWRMLSRLPTPLTGVSVGADDVWAVGYFGYAARSPLPAGDDSFVEVATGTERCLRAVLADDAWGVWAVGGSCPEDANDLGVVLHLGDPAIGGGPVLNREVDGGPTDGGADATPSDAAVDAPLGIGPGEECPSGMGCAPGLLCWFLADVYVFVCTRPCNDADECTDDFGDSCCVVPGSQTATTVCVPLPYGACD